MKTFFFIIIGLSLFSCKKYNCECSTESLSHSPSGNTPSISNKQISAISKSRAIKECNKYDHQGSYGGDMTTCLIK